LPQVGYVKSGDVGSRRSLVDLPLDKALTVRRYIGAIVTGRVLMNRNKVGDPNRHQHLVAVRVNTEMLTAIDAEVERLRTQRPGAHVQRSDALREILHRALFELRNDC
jgi:hypothetical protein